MYQERDPLATAFSIFGGVAYGVALPQAVAGDLRIAVVCLVIAGIFTLLRAVIDG